ncbi:hypothetical protein GCM10008941_10960 [Rhizomicrobium palustre]
MTAAPSRGIAFKLTISQIVMAVIAVAAIVLLMAIYRLTEAQVSRDVAEANAQASLAFNLQRARKETEIDIIQIQQYLQDVSATRLVDGLGADDWTIVADYAQRFDKDIGEARQIAEQLGDTVLVGVLDKMKAEFPAYYETGREMAKAYIKDGPLGGNAAMPKFDAAATALTEAIKAADGRIAAIREAADAGRAAAAASRQRANDYMTILGVILAVVLVVVSVLILRFVRNSLLRPLARATHVLDEMACGNTDVSVAEFTSDDEMGQLVLALQKVRRNAQETYEAERRKEEAVISSLGKGLHALASGDLNYRLEEDMAGAFAALRADFNAALARLQQTIATVAETAGSVAHGAGEISSATDLLAKRAEHQAASLEETSAALQEITNTITVTAENAKEARDVVANAKGSAEKGGEVVTTAVAAMEEISKSSKKIFDIVGVIDEIAFQTNLLALNAGVEAARAGDSGRGFAVVASEVRALAQRCGKAAKEIKDLIAASHEQVESGVALVNRSGEALGDILGQVSRINALVADMAQVSEQQAASIKQITTAVSDMDTVTQQSASMVQHNREVAHDLSRQTGALAKLVAFFSTGSKALAPQNRRAA